MKMMKEGREHNPRRSTRGQLLLSGLITAGLTLLIGSAALLSIVATRHQTNGAQERLDNNTATDQDMQNIQDSQQDFNTSMQIAAAGGGLVGQSGPIPGTGVTDVAKGILNKDLQVAGIKMTTDAYTGKIATNSMDNAHIAERVAGRWKKQGGTTIMKIYERNNGYEGVYEHLPSDKRYQYNNGDYVFTDLFITGHTTLSSRHGYSYAMLGDDIPTGAYSNTSLQIRVVTDRILEMTSNCPKYGKSGTTKYYKWVPSAIDREVSTWNRIE